MESSLTKPQEPKSTAIQLVCPHCGSNQSSRGLPFTQKSLQHHIRKRHAEGINQESKPDNAITCEICGCWKSRRGIPFMTAQELNRHKTVAHGKSPSAPRNKTAEDPVPTVQPKSKVRQAQAMSSPVKFCPQCGCNVEVVAAALSIFI
jgi:hypothetical protein